MRGLAIVLAGCVFVGCASAGSEQPAADSNGGASDTGGAIDASMNIDGNVNPPIDAAPDAPPQPVMVTLSQTTNNTIATANSVACGGCNNTSNPCNSSYTAENAYYRVFALSDYGITNKPFNVSQVTFGVQEAGGTISVQVKIGTYAGTPAGTLNTGTTDFAGSITQIATTSVNVPATTTGATVVAQIAATIPANSNVVVSIFSPTHLGQANTYFYLGATNGGETKPGYVRAPSCSLSTATSTTGLGYPTSNLLINVTGTY